MAVARYSVTATPAQSRQQRRALICKETVLAFGFFFVATVFFTWPLLPNLGTRIIASGDYYLTSYIQAWVAHALAANPSHILDMNMLYPSKHVLADSENLFGNQVLFAPVYGISGNPLLAANMVTFLSFWLCALAMYILVHQITGNALFAYIAGFVYGFSPPRLAQNGHSQLLSMQWIPFAVLFLVLFLFYKRVSNLIAFSAFLLLQILCSLYLGYIAILVCCAFLLSTILVRRQLITSTAILQLGLSGVVLAALLFPILQVYRQAEKGNESASAVLSTTIDASATPLSSYLNIGGGAASSVYKPLLGEIRSQRFNWEKILFPGFLTIGLSFLGAVFGSWAILRVSRASETKCSNEDVSLSLLFGAILVVGFSYILSLGPYLWIHGQVTRIRLPFFWLRLWIPGLAMYRVPARFGLGTTFGIAILAAFGFRVILQFIDNRHWFTGKTHHWVLAGGVIVALAVEFTSAPFALETAVTKNNLPTEYRWLADQPPNTPIVELPITVRGQDTDPTEQAAYAYASIFHWQPLVNGYTGHIPTKSQELLRTAARLPAPDAAVLLSNVGLRFVVVHLDKMPAFQLRQWQGLRPNTGLALLQDFGTSRVYGIRAAEARAAAAEQQNCSAGMQNAPALLDSAINVPEALKNSDFEGGAIAPWGTFQDVTAHIDASRAHHGKQSLAEAAGVGSVYQDASGLVPGATYTFSAWISVSGGTTATAQMAIYDPTSDQVEFSPPLSGCDRSWQVLSISARAGSGGKLRLHLFRNGGSGSIFWDDVRVYRNQ